MFDKIKDLPLIQRNVCNSLARISRERITPVLDPVELSYQFIIVVEDDALKRLFGKSYRPDLDPKRMTPSDRVLIAPRSSPADYDKEIEPGLDLHGNKAVHVAAKMACLWSFKGVHEDAESLKVDANSVVLWPLRQMLEDRNVVDGFATITSVKIRFKIASGDDALEAVATIRGWRRMV